MFVAIVCDFSNEDHAQEVNNLLNLYGFKKIQKDLYETVSIKENTLSRLKKDIDRVTDSYDSVRFYQYPLDGNMIITSLRAKKWRRTILKE